MNRAISPIINIGNNILKEPKIKIEFTKNNKWNDLLNDLDNHSHLFLLACVGDKQIKEERAWSIPMIIAEEIGGFEFEKFYTLSKDDFKDLFSQNSLHRFNNDVSIQYFEAVQKIANQYNDVAKNIWRTTNSSTVIQSRMLEFNGVGQKIASMTVNILLRSFKENIEDKQWIDVSVDRHVIRVFKRTGIVREEATKEEIIWRARELNPKYPGVFDLATFTIGKKYCKPTNPLCHSCLINNECNKIIT